MKEPVRKGNVYRSPAPAAHAYLVMEVGIKTTTVINIRSGREYLINRAALTNEYELIGTPYTTKKEVI